MKEWRGGAAPAGSGKIPSEASSSRAVLISPSSNGIAVPPEFLIAFSAFFQEAGFPIMMADARAECSAHASTRPPS